MDLCNCKIKFLQFKVDSVLTEEARFSSANAELIEVVRTEREAGCAYRKLSFKTPFVWAKFFLRKLFVNRRGPPGQQPRTRSRDNSVSRTVLARRSAISGHRTVAREPVPAVDAATVVQARATGTGRHGRRLTVLDQPQHLLVSTHFDEIHPLRVDHQITHATHEPTTPLGRPHVHGQPRPVGTETTHVEAIYQVQRRRTNHSGHHISPFVIVHPHDAVYSVLAEWHSMWVAVVKATMCCL